MDFKSSIGYLLHHSAFLLDSHCDQVLQERYGIGLSQFKILLVLEAKDGITQKNIARELSQTEASVSRQVKILAAKGLIEVEPSHDSKREKRVFETHLGHDIAQKSITALNDYTAPVFEGLSPKEQQNLQEYLRTIARGLE